jgi:hypothetical protein
MHSLLISVYVFACLLFNIALEKVITDAGLQRGGTIFYKLIQLLFVLTALILSPGVQWY